MLCGLDAQRLQILEERLLVDRGEVRERLAGRTGVFEFGELLKEVS